MSIETTIGIISGIIAIVTAIIQLKNHYFSQRKQGKEPFIKRLLAAKDEKGRAKVFEDINIYLKTIANSGISEGYIKGFGEIDKPELLFKDMCFSNKIKPTKDVCKKFMGENRPSLMDEYNKRFEKSKIHQAMPAERNNDVAQSVMQEQIVESHQVVYLSSLLLDKFPKTCTDLIEILKKHNVSYKFLKGTKDIWCRDYMPIQTPSGKLVQFRYEPSYLKGKKEWVESRSDVEEVCKQNNLHVTFSNINLDGGNVLMCEDRAIISSRIFTENPEYSDKDLLVSELEKLLEVEVIIIPCQNSDMTGHADGMVRFVNRNIILGNNREREYAYWRKGINEVIDKYKLTYIDVPFLELPHDKKHPISAIGIYVNFLNLDNLIVLPIFNKPEDKEVVDIIRKAFPQKSIETIDYNEVALEGGLLNCTTCVIRE